MGFIKIAKDHLTKALFGNTAVPKGLSELHEYFRHNGPISFEPHQEDGMTVAVSSNFRFGSIIAHGRDEDELDRNIRDAILTSFEIPSAYAKEANLARTGQSRNSYAAA